jgi:small subunit ribosomal protein S20
MANIKSAIKKIRVDARRKARNDAKRESYKGAMRDVRKAVTSKSKDLSDLMSKAYQQIDKAAKANVIHKGKADRLKSRLTAHTQKTATSAK